MTKKLYCYVDETGQDTLGKLFIVVAIVVEKEREILIKSLEKTELQSGKEKRKWIRTKQINRDRYLDTIFSLKIIKDKIYYQVFNETKSYQELITLVIAKAIHRYVEQQKINRYVATILIDGLKKTETFKISKALRDLGVKVRKVRGIKDESDAIIRLADTIAGVVRKAEQGNQKFKRIINKKNIFNKL